jgi:hypothetical protein
MPLLSMNKRTKGRQTETALPLLRRVDVLTDIDHVREDRGRFRPA